MSTQENSATGANYPRPSQDPNRMEVLVISQYIVATQHVTLVTYEMKRDGEGKLVALEEQAHSDDPRVSGVDTLLEAFVSGFRAGKSSRYN